MDFAVGSATLDDGARKRLDALAKALNDRPALKMDVAGHADAGADREALKQADTQRRVKAEKLKRLARDGKAPASVDEVTVAKEEYADLLKAAYREAPFPKPRNAIGMTKDLPVAEMETLMLANAQVSEQDIAQLGNRRALQATQLGGVDLPAGALVTLCIGAANRDPAQFERAEELDITRPNCKHLSFGFGVHQCAGLHLARLEGRVALQIFLQRFPHYQLTAAPVRGGRARFRGFLSAPFMT